MKVYLTGENGFIGKHVTRILLDQGHTLVQPEDHPGAMIHLAWRNLHDYESPEQMENVGWQFKLIEMLCEMGCRNITVPGTCWETLEKPPYYVQAKLALYERLQSLPILLKWIRAPYLYGHGQNENCLLPRLRQSIAMGSKQFRVVPGRLPFMPVETFAARLVDAMTDERNHISNPPGMLQNVTEFCQVQVPESADINFIADYPLRAWEK